MSQLVYAYNTRTGKKLAHQVPERWFDHPVLGANLSRTPRQKAAEKKTPNAPAAGDKKE